MENKYPPGIFNDVLGPVMRGPSSSHTAGSHRIGNVIRQLAGPEIIRADFHFHPRGSLATTYHTQGSDIGLAAGIIDMKITDPLLPESLKIARQNGIEINFNITEYPAEHPNTYLCVFENSRGEKFKLKALSTGGGIIEIISYQDFEFSVLMDLPVLFAAGSMDDITEWWNESEKHSSFMDQVSRQLIKSEGDKSLLIVEFRLMDPEIPEDGPAGAYYKLINPVYPSLGYTGSLLPFRLASELEQMEDIDGRTLASHGLEYESMRSGMSQEDIREKAGELVDIFRESIETGLAGTRYKDRIVHSQSPQFQENIRKGKLLPSGPLNRITAYIMAIMESKSAMEVIVAAPTAGAAGGLPGAILGMAEEIGSTREEIIEAFIAAGLAGVFIAADATFAAEVAGCQAETGAGAAMAAAGLVDLAGGNARQALAAASLALQNIMGLVCDPVANRVEIPCLGRNVNSAANALVSANMVLGGFDPLIPFSESIRTMLEVGRSMPRELRCTALGGLSITKTAKEIEKKLESRRNEN